MYKQCDIQALTNTYVIYPKDPGETTEEDNDNVNDGIGNGVNQLLVGE